MPLGPAAWAGWRRSGLGTALILGAIFAAYAPAIRGEFIWDDKEFITENSLITGDSGLGPFWTGKAPAGQARARLPDYWPLTYTALWIEWRLWGPTPRVSTLQPAAPTARVSLDLARAHAAWDSGASISRALLFAIDPVNVESVAWIFQHKNTLSMLFFLLSISWYLQSVGGQQKDTWPQRSPECGDSRGGEHQRAGYFPVQGRQWVWYGLSLAAFALSLLSKTATVMLPLILLACVWWLSGESDLRKTC